MELQSKTIAVLATEGFEDDELTVPMERVKAAGAEVHVISLQAGTFKGKNGTEIHADLTIEEADEVDYDGLLLPGGVQNPDILRTNTEAVQFVKSFFDADKPVAAICHAPWVLVEANVVEGRTLTSWPSLRTDLENAGALWVDEPVVVDQNMVTSRNPQDIPVFSNKAIELFAQS
jgi:protease I